MKPKSAHRRLRIIGGNWRGRQMSFADQNDVRPTPNRIRETLFNWLSSLIPNARCLDLFAGSGILSLEALSREAKEVTIIDQSPRVIELIQQQLSKFEPHPKADIWQGDVFDWIRNFDSPDMAPFDIVFVDPPFDSDMIPAICRLLEQHQVLSPDASIYIESKAEVNQQILPENWRIYRQAKASRVHYCLCKRVIHEQIDG